MKTKTTKTKNNQTTKIKKVTKMKNNNNKTTNIYDSIQ